MQNPQYKQRPDISSPDTVKGLDDTAPIRLGLNEVRLEPLAIRTPTPGTPESTLVRMRPGERIAIDWTAAISLEIALRQTDSGFHYEVRSRRSERNVEFTGVPRVSVHQVDNEGRIHDVVIEDDPVVVVPGVRLKAGRAELLLPYPGLGTGMEWCAYGRGAGILTSADGGRYGTTLFGEFAASTRRRVTLPPEMDALDAQQSRRFDRNNQDGFIKIDGFVGQHAPEHRTVFMIGDGLGSPGGGSVACREFFGGVQYALECGCELELARLAGAQAIEDAFQEYLRNELLEVDSVLASHPDPENRGETPSSEMGLCVVGWECRGSVHRFIRHGDCKAAQFRYDRASHSIETVVEVLADSPLQRALIDGSVLPDKIFTFPERNVASNSVSLGAGRLSRLDSQDSASSDGALVIETPPSDWFPIEQGDWVVLGSDGFWTRFGLSPDRVAGVLLDAHDPRDAWLRLDAVIKQHTLEFPQYDDDTTFMVYRHRISESVQPTAGAKSNSFLNRAGRWFGWDWS